MIYRLLTEQPERCILYVSRCQEQSCAFVPGMSVFASRPGGLYDALDLRSPQADTVLISDSHVPPVLSHPTVAIAFPGRADQNKLDYFRAPCYLPVPTVDEMLEMRSVAFPELSEEGVQRRMELWGPIPRSVFTRIGDEEQLELWRSVSGLGVEDVERAAQMVSSDILGAGPGSFDAHLVFTINPIGATRGHAPSDRASYRKGGVNFASCALANRFLESLGRRAPASNTSGDISHTRAPPRLHARGAGVGGGKAGLTLRWRGASRRGPIEARAAAACRLSRRV